jgi:ABC-type antimicrobial peptide transport system permease subunit
LYALLIGIFAGFALLLAAVGLYGVVAFTVGQRTKEIGLRMALGATSARVKAMFVGHAMGSVAAGVMLGAIGLFALMRVLDSFLYGMDPVDPVTLVSVAAVLAAVAIGASYLPARRASRLDPVDALRSE